MLLAFSYDWIVATRTPTAFAFMKAAKDLVGEGFARRSPRELSTTAASVRRVATGIDSIRNADVDLTASETDILVKASELLGRIATAHAQAAKLAQHRREEEERREQVVRTAMKARLQTLTSVEDQVALIAGINPSDVRHGFDLRDLADKFKEACDSIAYRLGRREPTASMTPEAAIDELWSRFQASRDQLVAAHTDLIASLCRQQAGTDSATHRAPSR